LQRRKRNRLQRRKQQRKKRRQKRKNKKEFFKMVALSLQLTTEDFYQFNYYTSWTASWNSRKRIIYYCRNILSAGIGSLLGVYLLERKISLTAILVAVVFALLLGFIGLPVWVRRFYRKSVDKFSANPSNSSFFSKAELIVDETGIQARDDVSTTMHLWRAFSKKVETDEYFYLYLNSQSGLVIPKRIFQTQTEKENFTKILLAHFPLEAELSDIEKNLSAK